MSFAYYHAGESPGGEEVPVLALEGRVTVEGFVEALTLIDDTHAHADLDAEVEGSLLLIDQRRSEFHARADELQRLVERLGLSPIARFALLVERDVDFGIGRMLETFAELQSIQFRVFRDSAPVTQWLRESVSS